jgi:hypothetical protein
MKTTALTLSLLMSCMTGTGSAFAGEITMWREPVPIVKEGKYYSLIVDRGELQKAVKNSNNDYLFSEKGNGVKPLVLIGTPLEISAFLLKNETRGIESHIKELPDIYMGITNYVPKERFTGLFPLHDLLTKTVEQALKFVPVGTILTDAAGIPSDLNEMYDVIANMKNKDKASGPVLYVKFSYLPEDGMKKVGSKTVSFGKILKQMQHQNY